MFDVATRKKLRFDTTVGALSVEDLWDLPLTSARKPSLDAIALDLHMQLKGNADVVSFVDETAKADPVVQLKFDIVKHIIDVRKKENADALAARDRARTKEQLLAALERRQSTNLENMSEEELRKRLAEL
jgi:hypothetical protein